MKGALLLLVQLGILLLLVTSFLVPCLLAEQYFKIQKPWPMVIGAGGLSLLLVGLFAWLRTLQKSDEKVRQTLHHSLFGEIKVLRNYWKAHASLPGENEAVELWGQLGKTIPTEDQTKSFEIIHTPSVKLLAQAQQACIDLARPVGVELSEPDLKLEGIWISATSAGQFSFSFKTPRVVDKIPWGLTVTFTDFKVKTARPLSK